jgi:hypothetical protein
MEEFVIDFDGNQDLSMEELWKAYPNWYDHAGTYYLDWGQHIIMCDVEEGKWRIGVYPRVEEFEWEEPVWFCEVIDEKTAVMTLIVATKLF